MVEAGRTQTERYRPTTLMNARVSRETWTEADSTEASEPHKGTCHNLLVLLTYGLSLSWVYKEDCLEPGREKTAKRQKKSEQP